MVWLQLQLQPQFVFNPSMAGKAAAHRNATLCYLGHLFA